MVDWRSIFVRHLLIDGTKAMKLDEFSNRTLGIRTNRMGGVWKGWVATKSKNLKKNNYFDMPEAR